MSEINVLVLKVFHLAIRVILVLACAFWALIVLEVLPAFFTTGMNGVRGKLVHIWSMGKVNLDLPWNCQDSLQLLHEGYTDLLLLVLLTWGLVEVKRFLDRRLLSFSRPEGGNPAPSIPPQGASPESSSLPSS